MSETERSTRPANRCGSCDQHVMVAALKTVLADRERELFRLKGPCSTADCGLHYAHSGPCDIPATTARAALTAAEEMSE